jgi:hypothetical protein
MLSGCDVLTQENRSIQYFRGGNYKNAIFEILVLVLTLAKGEEFARSASPSGETRDAVPEVW